MMDTYRNKRAYPFCPGCSHTLILNALDRALVSLQLDPRRVVLVSDIGCQGLGDQYFVTNAFHGLHGRSLAYATGIKLTDPGLKVIVLIGDGGTGIGGAHLLSAARRNIGLAVLVFNNFNFGMTGGEHSATTPTGGITATTADGNLERPLDLCATVAANGASFAWRGTAFDRDLADVMAQALQYDGFALLDIWELCTAYYAQNNEFTRHRLDETREALHMTSGGLARSNRPEFAKALRETGTPRLGQPALPAIDLEPRYSSSLDHQFHLVIAGSAGGKVRSAARMVGEAAVLSGLYATQSDSYPVTVKTGHSISELCLSPSEIVFAGCSRPDVLILVSEEGRRAATRYLSVLTPSSHLFVTPELSDLKTVARKSIIDPDSVEGIGRRQRTLLVVGAALRQMNLFPIEACEEAIRLADRTTYAEANLAALALSAELAGTAHAARGSTAPADHVGDHRTPRDGLASQ